MSEQSDRPAAAAAAAAESAPGAGAQPSEEELRAAYEAELSRLTSADVILQAAVSLLNIGGYRLGLAPPPGEPDGAQAGAATRDLEQVRDAIDGVRGLLAILERRPPADLRPLRDALSQLQLAYAREAGAAATAGQPPSGEAPRRPAQEPAAPGQQAPSAPDRKGPGEPQKRSGPGPAESSGRLWVPGR